MAKKKVKELVAEIVMPFLAENGYELFNVEYVKEVKDWYLRVFIERAEGVEGGGIGTDDCEKVSRFLSAKMDELDPIEQNYYLEVSSPGMDRPLLSDQDYVKYSGSLVDLNLYQAIGGKKTLTGVLVGLEDNIVVITDEKQNRIEIPKEKVAKTKLAIVF